MVESDATITWEACDQKFKPNQDWNHAWCAAPANLLPRFVLGVQPLATRWKQVLIRPNPANLTFAEGKIPTPNGPVFVRWENGAGFKLKLDLPPGTSASVEIPATGSSRGVMLNGRSVAAKRDDKWWIIEERLTGKVTVETK